MLLHIIADGGKALRNGEIVAIGPERILKFSLRQQYITDLHVRYGEIALPSRIIAIGGGETLGADDTVSVGGERVIEVPLRHQDVSELPVRRRQIALPSHVITIGGGKALSNG